MKRTALNLLACPTCSGNLTLKSASDDMELSAGVLHCEACACQYNIDAGVPRLVHTVALKESPSQSFGFQWGSWLAGGFEEDTIYGISLEREINEFLAYTGLQQQDLKGKTILDAGCGSGRLTRFLGQQGANAVGMDVHSSLADVQKFCSDAAAVTIVQGNILKPPLRAGVFDLVWSEGVIHHTGDTPKAFDCLARLVKPGGRMFVWVYWNQENNIYRRTRNALRIGHRLPMPVLYAICYYLGAVYWLAATVRRFLGRRTGKKPVTPIKLHAFRLFDHISPRHNTQHSEDEVRQWFTRNNFVNIVRTADLGLRGDKPA